MSVLCRHWRTGHCCANTEHLNQYAEREKSCPQHLCTNRSHSMHSRIFQFDQVIFDLSDRQIESSVSRWGINRRLHMAPAQMTRRINICGCEIKQCIFKETDVNQSFNQSNDECRMAWNIFHSERTNQMIRRVYLLLIVAFLSVIAGDQRRLKHCRPLE